MKHLSSKVLAGLLASVVAASVAPAFASTQIDAQPQCGDEKEKTGKGDEKGSGKDGKGEPKPKPPAIAPEL